MFISRSFLAAGQENRTTIDEFSGRVSHLTQESARYDRNNSANEFVAVPVVALPVADAARIFLSVSERILFLLPRRAMTERNRFEQASHLAFVAACTLLTIYAGTRLYDRWITPSPSASAISEAYHKGDKLEPVPGLDLAETPYTLLAFVRNGCQYCAASMEFYDLIAQRRSRETLRFVAVHPEPGEVAQPYITQTGVKFDKVIVYQPTTLRIRSVPYLVLLNSQGVVQHGWRGKLGINDEREVLRTLTALHAMGDLVP
jgi:hypothetical protein